MMWLKGWIFSGLRLSLPLIFAAYGGMLSERSGTANIALEAYILASSFTAATVMVLTHSLPLSIVAAVLASVLVGGVLCFFTLYAKADQIIAGMAINILVTGLIPVLSKAIFEVSGNTPALEAQDRLSSQSLFFFLAIFVFIFIIALFSKSVFGLRLLAAGENPQALRTQGVSVEWTRAKAILLGAAIAAIGGIYLSIGAGSGYTRNMSGGRGYIALAALIFGRWKPIPTLLGCLIFAMAEALQILLQSVPLLPGGETLPSQFIQALPYVITLLFLAGVAGKMMPPKAINQPDL
jgi:simple sugar transport system permease protein